MENILDQAIELLDEENKKNFNTCLEENNSYHKWNMFICKSRKN